MLERSKISRGALALSTLLAACAQQPTEAPDAEPEGPLGVATQAIAPPAVPVKVANSNAEAVPTKATGTTTVDGSVAATQAGAWNVGIVGAPTVAAQQSGGWDVNVAGDVSLAPGSTIIAQQDQSAPWNMNVTNTPTVALAPGSAVGVTGAVSIANTPTVNVASMPPLNVGPVTVTGMSSVEVTNDETNPAIVRNADEPARQPFQRLIHVQLPANISGMSKPVVVPAGKRLVAQSVSVRSYAPTGNVPYVELSSMLANQEGMILVPLTDIGNVATGLDMWIGTTQGILYAESQASAWCYRDVSVGTLDAATCFISVTGYLIDI